MARHPRRPFNEILLDQFSRLDLASWTKAGDAVERFHRELHFGMEAQRRKYEDELLQSLRTQPNPEPLQVSAWVRLVDYQYTLDPLSSLGSLHWIGGRFNIGNGLQADGFPAFPALYLAEDEDTGYLEKFGPGTTELTGAELALSHGRSYTKVSLDGLIEDVFDLCKPDCLRPFCKVVREKMRLPKPVKVAAKKAGFPAPRLLNTADALHGDVMKDVWRELPAQLGLPANCQILGRLLRRAGYQGVLYPSARGGKRCLALFPDQFKASSSSLEIRGEAPSQVVVRVLNSSTYLATINGQIFG